MIQTAAWWHWATREDTSCKSRARYLRHQSPLCFSSTLSESPKSWEIDWVLCGDEGEGTGCICKTIHNSWELCHMVRLFWMCEFMASFREGWRSTINRMFLQETWVRTVSVIREWWPWIRTQMTTSSQDGVHSVRKWLWPHRMKYKRRKRKELPQFPILCVLTSLWVRTVQWHTWTHSSRDYTHKLKPIHNANVKTHPHLKSYWWLMASGWGRSSFFRDMGPGRLSRSSRWSYIHAHKGTINGLGGY